MSARYLLLGCSVLGLSCAAQAHAQSASTEAKSPSADTGDIIVTAQRKSESVQKVPIAITVVSGELLKTNNFSGLSDAQYLAPSLKYTATPAAPSFSIRGVGSQAYDYSIEQSVGISLDDVIQGFPRSTALNTLADVERIEVLRGPQGTLFGKNTSSGLISITTRRPVIGEFGDEGHAEYGSRNDLQIYDIVNIPLGDTLAARFRASYQSRDALYQNRGPGILPNNRDYSFNGKLLWKPTDTLSFYFIGDYQNSRGDPGIYSNRSFGSGTFAPGVGNNFIRDTLTALGIVPGPFNRLTALGTNLLQTSKTWSTQLTTTLDIGEHTLTSITAYKKLKYYDTLEADSSPLTVLDDNIANIDADQFTQELRLSSPAGQVLEYTVGAYYYDLTQRATQQQSGGLGYLPNQYPVQLQVAGGLLNYGNKSESYAAFGEFSIRPVEQFRIFVGARYTHDTINSSVFVSQLPNVCGLELLFIGVCHSGPLPTTPNVGSTSRGDYTARGGIEYQVTPSVMVYSTISRGYKGAGFATVTGSLLPVRPETVISEEIGVKSQFFDHKLTLNVNAFHSKYKDFQAQIYDPAIPPTGVFTTGNAGGLKTQGVEADFAIRPLHALNISGSFAYIDAKYTDYKPACYAGQTAAQGCTLPGPTFDAKGMPLTNAPKWSYNFAVNYEPKINSNLVGLLSANYSYRSSVYYQIGDPATVQPGYGIINASIGIATHDKGLSVRLFAQNLANKHFTGLIFPSYFDAGGYSQIINDASLRRFGAALDFRF